MKKVEFESKWYYRWLQFFYWGSLVVFSIVLTLLGYFESDVEISGLFWSGVLVVLYLIVKKIFYYIFLNE